MERIDLEALRERLAERLRNQTEAHRGGSRHIGTGGTSPLRATPGGTPAASASAGRGATARRPRSPPSGASATTAPTRRWACARWGSPCAACAASPPGSTGPATELDLDDTIDATADAGGNLRLVFRRPRRNAVRVLLLLDVGGSMDEHAALVDRLFSAVHQGGRFRDLTVRYFHNCVYDRVYETARLLPSRSEPTLDLLARMAPDHKLVVVGDACMAPSELTMVGGAIDWYQHNDEPGWVWLERLAPALRRARPGSTRCRGRGGSGPRRAHARRRADDLPDARALARRPGRGGRRPDGRRRTRR